jgi:O-antigen/teichoic acid export membrane protein
LSSPSQKQNLAVTIGKNTLFGVISGFAQVATRFVTIPIVIAHLGLGGYGVWAVIMSMASYMRFGSVGAKCAFQKYVADATGNGDYATASRLLSSGCGIMFVLSVVGLIPVVFLSHWLARIGGVPPEFLNSAAGAISVLAIIMVLSNVGAVFEAIVMGGHRIDLARRFTTFFSVAEAVAIVILLHLGYGLFGMATVMGLSEVGFVGCCLLASRRVVPQIHVSPKNFDRSLLRELLRFAGSYQLVSVLQVIYMTISPIAILRIFGAEFAGICALARRLLTPAQMVQDSFLLPILSGGSMVHAAGEGDRMQALLHKSFKVTLMLSLLPVAFVGAFGKTILFAWTGETAPQFTATLWLFCIAAVFLSFSQLGLVLYRVTGRAVMDNVRELLRIAIALLAAVLAGFLGFYGMLTVLVLAEAAGMLFMMYALKKSFQKLPVKEVGSDFLRLVIATVFIIAAGLLASHVPLPAIAKARIMAWLHLAAAGLGCALAAWPALILTRSLTTAEAKTMLHVLLPRRFMGATALAQSAG